MSLALTYDEIRREAGRFLAVGTDFGSWSSDVTTGVSDAIRRGSRRFYYPEAISLPEGQGALAGHAWSFLQTDMTINIVAGTQYYDLPTDFVRITERPTIAGSDYPLAEIREHQLRDLINAESGVGNPQYYVIKRNATGGTLRYQIGLYPTPVNAAVLSSRYLFNPPAISSMQEPIVNPGASEAFLAAILASADEIFNYETQSEGRQLERFKTLLAAAILSDQQIGGA